MDAPVTSAELQAPRFLRAKQAAAMVGMSVGWLYMRVHSDNPPPHKKAGRVFLFPQEAFTAWASRDVIE